MSEWILVATAGDLDPRVIAIGRTRRPLKPLKDAIRGPRRTAICAAVDAAVETSQVVETVHAREGFRVVAEPLVSPTGVVAGVRVCAVPHPATMDSLDGLPERLPSGAWSWDMQRGVMLASSETFDVYQAPPSKRLVEMYPPQWLPTLTDDMQAGFAALSAHITGADGDEMVEQWPVRRLDGVLRDMVFAARVVGSVGDRWVHGVVSDITEGVAAVPPDPSFSGALLEAELAVEPDWYRAVFDLKTLGLVRWLSEPPPMLLWLPLPDSPCEPGVHPDDHGELERMAGEVMRGPAQVRFRARGVDCSWLWVEGTASLMPLDPDRDVYGLLLRVQVESATASGTVKSL
ncbi:hypothetical protein ACT17_15335 [Mycolicibacterium conceptionense]|uniref:Uncharacterized protein n=1 Tax=Mycolicibacterium conceptionense TaxID=451644 RepID=A0A0J8U7Y7_9MYCO|nr:GAF domain-containing protein [Mycolicibacterium conceptionense]KMV17648.1 hypothetical protein ACT17_15335 [Mycolicibacterium conceptionense]